MSRRVFDRKEPLPLPTSAPVVSNIHEFLDRSDFEIRPVIPNLPVADKPPKFDIQWSSFKITVHDGIELKESAIKAAKSFRYEAETYRAFVKRLQGYLSSHLDLLLSSYCKDVHDKDILKQHFENMSNDHRVLGDYMELPTVLYVPDEDSDALFHLSKLMYALISVLIAQSEPPGNLFSFIPIAEPLGLSHSFDSLVMVFQTADVGAAANACLQSLTDSEGTRRWKSAIILVEEAIESHFVKQLRKIMGLLGEKTQGSVLRSFPLSPGAAKRVENYVQRLKASQGVTVIEPKDGNLTMGPIVLTDTVPSTLKDNGNLDLGPLAHVLRFRTLKEALSIASYICSSRQNHITTFSPSAGDLPFVAELWSDSASVIWRSSSHLAGAGISTIFVNSPYVEKARVIYEFLSRCSLCSTLAGQRKPPNEKLVDDISSLLSLAKKAQESWCNLGMEIIHERVSQLVRSETPLEPLGLLDAVHSQRKSATEDSYLMPLPKNDNKSRGIFVARSWSVPIGPVIMTMENPMDEKQCNLTIFKLVEAVAAGNSVLMLSPKCSKDSRFLTIITFLQHSLPSNVLQFYEIESFDENLVLSLLSTVRHPGCFMPQHMHTRGTIELRNTTYGCYPFTRKALMFWSIGGEIFSN
ncbi:unnamed protein product [Echinostoma caproni]|uniref:Aldedh domain-containing protein n=1 Tax=Echinostoma caproni TaxID=27848 RepID=A0A183A2A7_9TREM|nr:unnamed protein product [Echinostoma caproni]